MKKLLLIFASCLCLSASDKTVQEIYIERYSGIAVSEMHRTGVPASITLAQGLLESRSGQSVLAVEGNNHFGIKCHSDWKGKTMTLDDDSKGECFRVYDSPEQSYTDHSDFLRFKDRYRFLFSFNPGDYKSWAVGLKQAGYATDPKYPTKLITLIEKYNLARFDTSDRSTVPQTPAALEVVEKASPNAGQVEVVGVSLSREFIKNGVHFVYAEEGDTYRSLASYYKIGFRQLLRYNDLSTDAELLPGTPVYIEFKKNKAAKGLDKYIVSGEGESLYDICQRFAVKQKSICRLNGLNPDYVPKEGDTILLR